MCVIVITTVFKYFSVLYWLFHLIFHFKQCVQQLVSHERSNFTRGHPPQTPLPRFLDLSLVNRQSVKLARLSSHIDMSPPQH